MSKVSRISIIIFSVIAFCGLLVGLYYIPAINAWVNPPVKEEQQQQEDISNGNNAEIVSTPSYAVEQYLSGESTQIYSNARSVGPYSLKGFNNLKSLYLPNVSDFHGNINSITINYLQFDNLISVGFAAFSFPGLVEPYDLRLVLTNSSNYCAFNASCGLFNTTSVVPNVKLYVHENLFDLYVQNMASYGNLEIFKISDLNNPVVFDKSSDKLLDALISGTAGGTFESENITHLRDYAFAQNYFESIILPNLVSYGTFPFCLMFFLTSLVIPSVEVLSNEFIYHCPALTKLDLPLCTTFEKQPFMNMTINVVLYGYVESVDFSVPANTSVTIYVPDVRFLDYQTGYAGTGAVVKKHSELEVVT